MLSFVSGIVLKVIDSKVDKSPESKGINDYLLEPDYNFHIPHYLTKNNKRRMVIIHFMELDRLRKWISTNNTQDDDSETGNKAEDVLVHQILETIGLMYSQNNFKIAIEIDHDIAESVFNKHKQKQDTILFSIQRGCDIMVLRFLDASLLLFNAQ